MITVELHTHTCYSKDCLTAPGQFILECRRKGLDRVAVTDHNTTAGAFKLKAMAPDLIVVGEEIRTDCGEIIAYFLSEEVPPDLPVRQAIARVRDQGGIVGVSHPADRLRREAMGIDRLLPIIDRVDALEVFNARCLYPADNDAAHAIAAEYGKPGFAGSDAHTLWELGRASVSLEPFDTPQQFLENLKSAYLNTRLSSPLVHFASTWAKWMRRLHIAPRPV
ncbi:MAG TPA: PHP domain-containing protein [Anaerolineae bacterium]|nr:PHP domain-containing protein [Anaerolineae bacterium]